MNQPVATGQQHRGPQDRGRKGAIVAALAGAVAAAAAASRILRRKARPTAPSGSGEAFIGRGGRTSRTLGLAQVGARAGADLAVTRVRSALADDATRDRLRAEFEVRTAEQVADLLGNMKGALMKIGQMASYLDQGLPEPVRDALAQLQSDAPPMAFELVESTLEAELGGPLDRFFDHIDPVPLASASIGQVHRAVTRDGVDVAVKVQYPGVDRAIRADLENTDMLFGAMSMMFPGMDPKPIVAELKERISEELDYQLEARNQKLFHEYYVGHPTVTVPDVVDHLCTERVLTTRLATGVRFGEVLGWSQEERNLAAETIYRFVFGGIYRLGAFNGDPHPGNYLFEPGGRVTFLDFGLVKHFTDAEVGYFGELIEAMVLHQDMGRFRRVSEEIGLLPKDNDFTDEEIHAYFSHFYETVLERGSMTITPELASESVRRFFDLTSPHARMMKAANLPPSFVIIQRINLGLFAVLAELNASGDWRAVAEELWPFVNGEPSTPMGEAIRAWELDRAERDPHWSRDRRVSPERPAGQG